MTSTWQIVGGLLAMEAKKLMGRPVASDIL
jgi:hypothetical protein